MHYTDFTPIWDDAGSGGELDFSCYAASGTDKPHIYGVGHFGINVNENGPKPRPWVVSLVDSDETSTIFRRPTIFSRIWTDKGTGAYKDGSFWKVNCPNGYNSLADLCQRGYDDSKPSKSAVSCIKQEYLEDDLHNTFIWNDKWTGSSVDVDINGGVMN